MAPARGQDARVWELNESRLDPEYEMDTRLCDFAGNETYWSSRELDWLVYVSHESSIAFTGLCDFPRRARGRLRIFVVVSEQRHR